VPIELSADLPAPLVPLAWLVGSWAGAGVVGYPTVPAESRFGQEVEFETDGRPFLRYNSRPAAGRRRREGAPLGTEAGFWRPGAAAEGGGIEVEVLLAHPTGFVEIYLGTADGPRSTWRPTSSPARRPPRSTRPRSGCTAWSRATCCGRWTWPRSASSCSPTPRPA
jgi:hypothetical protein